MAKWKWLTNACWRCPSLCTQRTQRLIRAAPANAFRKGLHCYKIKFILFLLTPVTRCVMYWPCMDKHGPFQMVMSEMICAEWGFKGLSASATSEQNNVLNLKKTFISISFVSFVTFLLLRLLILTWVNESELGYINSTPLFCANRFWHAWI